MAPILHDLEFFDKDINRNLKTRIGAIVKHMNYIFIFINNYKT